ncbi:hypothetical protein [Streptomyces sp. NPDC059262]|uniref:hypothetical protein n=1 Tax=Streptomyces sp. NPDC059262 TaxID=3346797 RepID=UPI00368760ED
MHPAPALHHLDSPFVNFRDFDFGEASHGYHWINTKRFGLPTEAPDDRALLAALIAHPQFRDTYDGAGVQDWPRHGQWWLERIAPGAYQTVDASTATGRIRAWAGRHGDVPQELEARLEEHLYAPIARRPADTYWATFPRTPFTTTAPSTSTSTNWSSSTGPRPP